MRGLRERPCIDDDITGVVIGDLPQQWIQRAARTRGRARIGEACEDKESCVAGHAEVKQSLAARLDERHHWRDVSGQRVGDDDVDAAVDLWCVVVDHSHDGRLSDSGRMRRGQINNQRPRERPLPIPYHLHDTSVTHIARSYFPPVDSSEVLLDVLISIGFQQQNDIRES